MATSPPPFHLPSLDGLRAVSIGIVFLAHAGWGDRIPGGLGVTVFFFLSGFLIASLLRREQSKTGQISIKNFYIRRAFRILPPFYLVLAVAGLLAIVDVLPGSVSRQGMLALALHLGNYVQIFRPEYAIPQGSGVYWSLAVEEHYYLTFPFLAVWLLKKDSRVLSGLALGGLALLVMIWRVVLVNQGAPELRTYYASDTRVDSILWGALLALSMNPKLDPMPRFALKLRWPLLGGAGLVMLGTLVYRDEAFRETYRYTLQSIALLPLFYYAVGTPDWPPFRWLNGRFISYLGALSYMLYLVHHIAIYAIAKNMGHWPLVAQATLALVISAACAALSFRYIETPLARMRKRFN